MSKIKKVLKMITFSSMSIALVLSNFEESKASQSEAILNMSKTKSYHLENGWYSHFDHLSSYKPSKTFDRLMFFAFADTRYTCIAESDSDVDIYAYNHLGQNLGFDDTTSKTASVTFDKGFSGNIYIDVKMHSAIEGGGYYSLWCGYK